ncbi:MAG: hypothetical protein M1830_007749, partial [Pleopsidium flavum]
LKGSAEVDVSGMRREFGRVARERILGGEFAVEFEGLDEGEGNGDGEGVQRRLGELYEEAAKSELAVGEKRVRDRLGLKTV